MNKISVALATYNGEKYIIQQLDSLRKQTRKPEEVIIVDDCSSDNTFLLVKQYIDENHLDSWHLFQNVENLGFINNFKKAISQTSGDLIFLCDQDDIWMDDKIEKLANIMENHHNINVLTSDYLLIDSQGNEHPLNTKKKQYPINYFDENCLHKVSVKELAEGNNAPGCTCCFTSHIRDIYLEDSNPLNIPHDYLINLLGVRDLSSYHYNEKLTMYRIHSSNTIGIGNEAKVDRGYDEIYYKQYKYQYLLDLLKMYLYHIDAEVDNDIAYIEKKIRFFDQRNITNLLSEVNASFKSPMVKEKTLFKGALREAIIDSYYLLYYRLSKIKQLLKKL